MAIGASSLLGVGAVSAQSSTGAGPTALIQKIAQRFGLNEDEVKAVFDENRTEHEAERQAKFAERLNQAATDGEITEGQKTQILAKQDELKTFMDSLSDMSQDQRREAMKTKMDEIRSWAEENNIPFRYLHMGGRRGHHGNFGDMGLSESE